MPNNVQTTAEAETWANDWLARNIDWAFVRVRVHTLDPLKVAIAIGDDPIPDDWHDGSVTGGGVVDP